MREREYVIRGRLPWYSIDAMANYISSDLDSKEERNQCLSCPYAECINCHCKDKTTQMIDQCEELILQHKTRQQICELLHISRATFFRYQALCAL